MTKEKWKHVLVSILVGALVAFLTSFLEGLLNFLQGQGNDIIAGGASSIAYLARNMKV